MNKTGGWTFSASSEERGEASWNANSVREVYKPSAAGYRDFTDSVFTPSDGCKPDSFPEGESRMKKAAA